MFRVVFLPFLMVASLWGFSPTLDLIEPRGGQRGTEIEVRFIGDRLFAPEEILLYHPGISLKSLTPEEDAKSVRATLVIAPDAPLGEHPMRLRCQGGITYMRTFWVGQFPTVFEKRTEDGKADLNNSFDQAQEIPLNVTVQGVADSEDDDYYRVEAKAGQRLSVEVEGMRLGRVMFDPYVAILDQNRFEIATNDDSPLLKRDCFASVIVPTDGFYTILVRESSYQGNPQSQYRMHVGTFPRPVAVFPPAAKAEEEVTFTFIGDARGPLETSLTTPPHSFAAFAESEGLLSPSGIPVRISPLDYLQELEPNNTNKEATIVSQAPPFALHGVIHEEDELDYYRITAKKDQTLRIHVLARELRSPLDPVLAIRFAKDHKFLESNDDLTQGNPDSRLDFKVPEDGDYFLIITDQLKRGGPSFTYRVEIETPQPSLSATLPMADRNDTQKDKMIHVPRGNRLAIVPNVTRERLRCDLAFHAPKLPEGLKISTPSIPNSLTSFPVLFEAAPDAPIAGGLYHFEIEDPETQRRGSFFEKIAHLYVNNQGDYQVTETEKIAIAVIEEAPFHLELFAPPVPLVRNGTMDLRITAKRAPDFDQKIKVVLPWKPLGINAPTDVTIPEKQSEVTLTLSAAGDAPLGDWQLLVTGEAETGRGLVKVSSAFVPLKVAEPFLQLTLAMAATNPGKATNVIASIEHLEAFAGEAIVTLHALPHGVKTTPQKITSESSEVTFPLEVADDANKGKHANLFCQVVVSQAGHPVAHNLGHGGTLRIDPPPPAPKNPAPTPAVTPDEKKPAEKKPLSRLEQLRQANAP